MSEKSNFVKEFFKEKKQVGAIAPSSKFLMKKMLKPIDFSKAMVIVELGPGNGVFTKGILAKMRPDAKLISFELNENFYNHIRNTVKDSRLILINESAEQIENALIEHGLHGTDYVVSSLPLAVIPNPIKTNILDASVKHLNDGGSYIQFQYSLNAKKLLESKFKEVKISFTPVNIPPAFVYRCKN